MDDLLVVPFVASLVVAAWLSDRLHVHWAIPVAVALAIWVVGFWIF